jgi:hypothetical protein
VSSVYLVNFWYTYVNLKIFGVYFKKIFINLRQLRVVLNYFVEILEIIRVF